MWKPGKLIWKHMENTYGGKKTSNMKHIETLLLKTHWKTLV